MKENEKEMTPEENATTTRIINEGYVEWTNIEAKEKVLGVSDMGLIAADLLNRLNPNHTVEMSGIPPDQKKIVSEKLVKEGYVEHRMNREINEEQVRLTEKGAELLSLLSVWTKSFME